MPPPRVAPLPRDAVCEIHWVPDTASYGTVLPAALVEAAGGSPDALAAAAAVSRAATDAWAASAAPPPPARRRVSGLLLCGTLCADTPGEVPYEERAVYAAVRAGAAAASALASAGLAVTVRFWEKGEVDAAAAAGRGGGHDDDDDDDDDDPVRDGRPPPSLVFVTVGGDGRWRTAAGIPAFTAPLLRLWAVADAARNRANARGPGTDDSLGSDDWDAPSPLALPPPIARGAGGAASGAGAGAGGPPPPRLSVRAPTSPLRPLGSSPAAFAASIVSSLPAAFRLGTPQLRGRPGSPAGTGAPRPAVGADTPPTPALGDRSPGPAPSPPPLELPAPVDPAASA
jgi:hypothetical protein